MKPSTRTDCLPMPARFWSKVRITPGCWLWQAAKDRRGYGRFGINGKVELAHRISLALQGTAPTADVLVLHRCDTPGCVNPDHLFFGTHEDNMADMAAKGRANKINPSGSKAHHAKLTLEQAEEIRRLRAAGVAQLVVARQFGVHRCTVQEITQGRAYTC